MKSIGYHPRILNYYGLTLGPFEGYLVGKIKVVRSTMQLHGSPLCHCQCDHTSSIQSQQNYVDPEENPLFLREMYFVNLVLTLFGAMGRSRPFQIDFLLVDYVHQYNKINRLGF